MVEPTKRCHRCDSQDLYRLLVPANSGFHDLMPKLGSFVRRPMFNAVVCYDCGFVDFYLDKPSREKLKESKLWKSCQKSG